MNRILILSLLLSSFSISQTGAQKDFLSLKNEIKNINNIQNEVVFNYWQVELQKKNPGIGILLSLLLPGMGELYAESYSSGQYFTIAEGALWLTYIGINSYGNWQKDNYTAYAASKGGVDVNGKNEKFFSLIGDFKDVQQYNNQKALERNFSEMYDENLYYWKWENTSERRSYRAMWLSSEQAYNNLRFVVGALILNRLASAVNAVRLINKYNKNLQDESWKLSVGYSSFPNDGIRLSVTTNF